MWVILKYGNLKGRSLFYKISNLGLGGWGWRFVGQGFCNTHKLIFEVQEKKKWKTFLFFRILYFKIRIIITWLESDWRQDAYQDWLYCRTFSKEKFCYFHENRHKVRLYFCILNWSPRKKIKINFPKKLRSYSFKAHKNTFGKIYFSPKIYPLV